MFSTLKNIDRTFNNPFFDYDDLLGADEKYKSIKTHADFLRILKTGEMSTAFPAFLKEKLEPENIVDVNTVDFDLTIETKHRV